MSQFNDLAHVLGSNAANRRQFIEYAAKSCLGVSVLSTMQATMAHAQPPVTPPGPGSAGAAPQAKAYVPEIGVSKAKRLIYLYMGGAMTHLDTFDLKPGHKNQGQTRPISTSVPGAQISEFLPNLAKDFNKLAVIRSLSTQTADHEAAEYWMRTSYQQIATERHPSLGPWIQRFRGRQSKTLPDTVLISAPARHPGAGFFDPTYSPLPIGDPNRGLENTTAPAYLTDASLDKRLTLIDKFDKNFRSRFPVQKVQSYTDFYAEAVSLLSSKELKAFNLNEEKDADRNRYGRDAFGQGCLLARRLVENNVTCVEVSFGGWDMHSNIYEGNTLPARCRVMDQAVSALLKDLADRGLLNETLVVLTTEFGRSPEINGNAGRDHHPAAFSSVLAGGGIRGGMFYGTSDAAGHAVDSDGVTPADLNATIATALGLPLKEVVTSYTGRPFMVAHDGKPIDRLFA
jgi:Protein of unknown function (DUF1501)